MLNDQAGLIGAEVFFFPRSRGEGLRVGVSDEEGHERES